MAMIGAVIGFLAGTFLLRLGLDHHDGLDRRKFGDFQSE